MKTQIIHIFSICEIGKEKLSEQVETTYRQNQRRHIHVHAVDLVSRQDLQWLCLDQHECGKHYQVRPVAECRGTFEKDPGRRSECGYEPFLHLCWNPEWGFQFDQRQNVSLHSSILRFRICSSCSEVTLQLQGTQSFRISRRHGLPPWNIALLYLK